MMNAARVEIGNDTINYEYVVMEERRGDKVFVHLSLPTPEYVGGVMPNSGVRPVATGHVTKIYPITDWVNACDAAFESAKWAAHVEKQTE